MADLAARPSVGLMLPSIPHHADGVREKERIIKAAVLAEAAGFDSIYIGDHLLHPNPLMEAIVTLSMVAGVTERVSIGFCVMLIALREPLWLAKQLGTLEFFAPGRLRLGIGVGGAYPGEFDAVGVKLPARGKRTEEVLRTLREAFAGRLPPFDDGGVSIHLQPAPKTPVPFLFAGREEAAMRRAATLGDGWIGYLLSPDRFADNRAFMLEHRARSTAAPFSCGMLLHAYPDHQLEGAHERAAAGWARITRQTRPFPHPEELFIAGPPEAMVSQLRRYWDAGCTEIVLAPADQGALYLDQVEVLATEVLPQLKTFSSAA